MILHATDHQCALAHPATRKILPFIAELQGRSVWSKPNPVESREARKNEIDYGDHWYWGGITLKSDIVYEIVY